MSATVMSEKKKVLMAYKEKLLEELKYYEKQIEHYRSNGKKEMYLEDSDSSASDTELPSDADFEPNITQLKLQQTMMRTCLQATQELTNVQVMESEVNVLSEDPVYQGEPPVSEPGLWREVTAECRVDLVPFCITFFTHQPNRLFAPLSYRNLHVTAVKTAHEAELNRSILSTVNKPSDAVEILKSYALAHRSRRTTLARLAEKFANSLYMEPMSDGGYHLKCANLLEVSWVLQNKWSPVAPFQHRMKFDLEYMDESYIKKITLVHRQLTDPSIETDERTFLLSKIISICLEAQGPTQELYESMSSDPETAHALRKRRTTLDKEIEPPVIKKKKDSEVMAPPKTLPKKAKPKGKENINKLTADTDENVEKTKKNNKEIVNNEKTKPMLAKNHTEPIITTNKKIILKKANTDPNLNEKVTEKSRESMNKKPLTAKTFNTESSNNKDDENKEIPSKVGKDNKQKTIKKKATEDQVQCVANAKAKANPTKQVKERLDNEENAETVVKAKNKTNPTKLTKEKNVKANKINNAEDEAVKDKGNKLEELSNAEKVTKAKNKLNPTKTTKENNVVAKKTNNAEQNPANTENIAKLKKKINKATKENIIEEKSTNNAKEQPIKEKGNKPQNPSNSENLAKSKLNASRATNAKNPEAKNINKEEEKVKSVVDVKHNPPKLVKEKATSNDKQVPNDVVKSVASTKSKVNPTRLVTESNKETNKNIRQNKESKPKDSNTEKQLPINVAILKRKSNLVENARSDTNIAAVKKPRLSKPDAVIKNNADNKTKTQNVKIPTNIINVQSKAKIISGINKVVKTGNTGKVINTGNIGKSSAEKVSRIPQIKSNSEVNLKKNPFKLSPLRSTTKLPTAVANKQKIAKTTNIPRLLKKPSPKS